MSRLAEAQGGPQEEHRLCQSLCNCSCIWCGLNGGLLPLPIQLFPSYPPLLPDLAQMPACSNGGASFSAVLEPAVSSAFLKSLSLHGRYAAAAGSIPTNDCPVLLNNIIFCSACLFSAAPGSCKSYILRAPLDNLGPHLSGHSTTAPVARWLTPSASGVRFSCMGASAAAFLHPVATYLAVQQAGQHHASPNLNHQRDRVSNLGMQRRGVDMGEGQHSPRVDCTAGPPRAQGAPALKPFRRPASSQPAGAAVTLPRHRP